MQLLARSKEARRQELFLHSLAFQIVNNSNGYSHLKWSWERRLDDTFQSNITYMCKQKSLTLIARMLRWEKKKSFCQFFFLAIFCCCCFFFCIEKGKKIMRNRRIIYGFCIEKCLQAQTKKLEEKLTIISAISWEIVKVNSRFLILFFAQKTTKKKKWFLILLCEILFTNLWRYIYLKGEKHAEMRTKKEQKEASRFCVVFALF